MGLEMRGHSLLLRETLFPFQVICDAAWMDAYISDVTQHA